MLIDSIRALSLEDLVKHSVSDNSQMSPIVDSYSRLPDLLKVRGRWIPAPPEGFMMDSQI